MNSLKQVIVNAIHKVSVDPTYSGKHYETPEDARADFVKSLIAELFPESPAAPESTYVEPKVEKKKRAPKAKKEEVVVEAKTEEAVAEVKIEVPVVPEVKEKKKRAPKAKKVEEAVAEVTTDTKHKEVVVEAKTEEVKTEEVKEKKKRAPKAKPEGAPKNIEKINPTQTKKLKENEVDKKVFLDHLNTLTSEEFNSKTFEEHILAFKNPPVVPATQELECFVVEYKGKEYYVDPKSKKVYNESDEYVGDVGMLEFKDMVIPSDF